MNQKTQVTVFHLGARKHYQEPILFHQWGILSIFYTDFYARDNFINKILRSPQVYSRLPKSLKKMLDRYTPELKGTKIVDFPLFGIESVNTVKKASFEELPNAFISIAQKFNQKIISKGLINTNTVYGFNSASLEVFEIAKSQGIKCLLDQTIAASSLQYVLLLEEQERWANWSNSNYSITEPMKRMAEREFKEQELADHIICGSNFVKESLIGQGISSGKITVVSLGKTNDSLGNTNFSGISKNKNQDILKILFVGTVELRKGIPYLLEALKILHDKKINFACKIAGDIQIRQERVDEYKHYCQFLGRVPSSEMSRLYEWADVFVLPSICEGSAMVIYEALMYGLPVITTYNSGSVVRDLVDGFIVPIREAYPIAEALLKIYSGEHQFSPIQTQLYLKELNKQSCSILMQLVMA
jgi:glycosyltransferase involved in cell wall biosynthesis